MKIIENINITTFSEEENEKSIGQQVVENYRKAEIFKKYGIDFCCGGKKTLSKVCKEKNLDLNLIMNELNKAESAQGFASQNFQAWDAGFLAEYIVNTHHKYVKSAIPFLLELTKKVARVHGADRPELIDIATLFADVADELTAHMFKEEQVLFPYIKQLSASHVNPATQQFPAFSSVEQPILMMEHEHEAVGELFLTIRTLSDNFTPPESACNSYRVSYSKLKEFEEDLHQHIHLENNILFPKALELEETSVV
ncbi:MAG: iron-sulfur cluster repair di-iron protein [Bacteroidia bacterium]|jgi:regulator of cell morphogenesis and NO signaling|nr:iron-sulfur cluster repair di-iron protein [Bacteroidia bacterium]